MAAQPTPGGSQPLIMIVDDDPATRHSLARLFHGEGYTIVEAANGLDALDHLAQARPAVVLLDIMMPGMNGLTFAQHCRQVPEYAALPIVALTAAYDAHASTAPLHACGINAVMRKPFNVAEVIATVAGYTPPATPSRTRAPTNQRFGTPPVHPH